MYRLKIIRGYSCRQDSVPRAALPQNKTIHQTASDEATLHPQKTLQVKSAGKQGLDQSDGYVAQALLTASPPRRTAHFPPKRALKVQSWQAHTHTQRRVRDDGPVARPC